MKQSVKPISSPNRTDYFPPPLMNFFKADVGSRSRSGRSRSSPIFVRKKNIAIETQEPSSPKVTCMGQVRARRSSKTSAESAARCRWIRTVLSFNRRHCRTLWNGCKALVFGRKRESRRKSSIPQSRVGNETEDSEEDEENERGEGAGDAAFAPSIPSPPKNALILTRCRSAPQRSSVSGYVYRSSPVKSHITGEERKPERDGGNKATSQIESENSGRWFKKLENSIGQGISNSVYSKESKIDEEKGAGGSSRLVNLTRCKSEPSSIAEKLYGELNLQKEGSWSGVVTNDSCLPNHNRLND